MCDGWFVALPEGGLMPLEPDLEPALAEPWRLFAPCSSLLYSRYRQPELPWTWPQVTRSGPCRQPGPAPALTAQSPPPISRASTAPSSMVSLYQTR